MHTRTPTPGCTTASTSRCIYTHTCMNVHIHRYAHAHTNPKMHDSEYQQVPALLCIPDLNPVQFLN